METSIGCEYGSRGAVRQFYDFHHLGYGTVVVEVLQLRLLGFDVGLWNGSDE